MALTLTDDSWRMRGSIIGGRPTPARVGRYAGLGGGVGVVTWGERRDIPPAWLWSAKDEERGVCKGFI